MNGQMYQLCSIVAAGKKAIRKRNNGTSPVRSVNMSTRPRENRILKTIQILSDRYDRRSKPLPNKSDAKALRAFLALRGIFWTGRMNIPTKNTVCRCRKYQRKIFKSLRPQAAQMYSAQWDRGMILRPIWRMKRDWMKNTSAFPRNY